MYSASTLVLRSYGGDFSPVLSELKGSWKAFASQDRETPPLPACSGEDKLAYEGIGWGRDIPDVTVMVKGCGVLNDQTHLFPCSPSKWSPNPITYAFVENWYGAPRYRHALMVGAKLQSPQVRIPDCPKLPHYPEACRLWTNRDPECLTDCGLYCCDKVWWRVRWEVAGQPLQGQPYLLRERFWERVPMDDQGLAAVWLVGDDAFEVTTTYRRGSDSTATNEFAKTLKVGAEGSFNVLKAGVEATIQQTYSTSITITASEERSYQKRLVGDAGKLTCHTLWQLVDQYRWADAGKNLFTDPSYEFVVGQPDARGRPVEFEVRGQELALVKTTFAQTGALERSELVAAR